MAPTGGACSKRLAREGDIVEQSSTEGCMSERGKCNEGVCVGEEGDRDTETEREEIMREI